MGKFFALQKHMYAALEQTLNSISVALHRPT